MCGYIMSGCSTVLLSCNGKYYHGGADTDYNIDGRAYGRILFDTNLCLERSDTLIRLGRDCPNQLVSYMRKKPAYTSCSSIRMGSMPYTCKCKENGGNVNGSYCRC